MAKRVIDGATLSAIADATRNLTGATGTLTPEQITSQLQAEINSGKVKLETCKVKFTSVESNGDLYGMRIHDNTVYSDSYYFTPLWQGDAFPVLKNSIVFIDTRCTTCTCSGGVTMIGSRADSSATVYGNMYVLYVTGDCELDLLTN